MTHTPDHRVAPEEPRRTGALLVLFRRECSGDRSLTVMEAQIGRKPSCSSQYGGQISAFADEMHRGGAVYFQQFGIGLVDPTACGVSPAAIEALREHEDVVLVRPEYEVYASGLWSWLFGRREPEPARETGADARPAAASQAAADPRKPAEAAAGAAQAPVAKPAPAIDPPPSVEPPFVAQRYEPEPGAPSAGAAPPPAVEPPFVAKANGFDATGGPELALDTPPSVEPPHVGQGYEPSRDPAPESAAPRAVEMAATVEAPAAAVAPVVAPPAAEQPAPVAPPAPAAEPLEPTWGLRALGADASPYSGAGVKVCILDTGIAADHPDFTGRAVTAVSFVAGESAADGQGHGTHVAGTAAGALQPASVGRYGVAHGAELFVGKVLSNNGSGREGDILAGIVWALEQGCAIISMSLGRRPLPGDDESDYERVGQVALEQGSLIIAAAGNESIRGIGIVAPVGAPANAPSIMAVGAIDESLSVAGFSNGGDDSRGGELNICAPGVDVLSALPPDGHASLSGTSMATPHVAGVAALLAESDPTLRGKALWDALQDRARDIGLSQADGGAGLVQAPGGGVS